MDDLDGMDMVDLRLTLRMASGACGNILMPSFKAIEEGDRTEEGDKKEYPFRHHGSEHEAGQKHAETAIHGVFYGKTTLGGGHELSTTRAVEFDARFTVTAMRTSDGRERHAFAAGWAIRGCREFEDRRWQ